MRTFQVILRVRRRLYCCKMYFWRWASMWFFFVVFSLQTVTILAPHRALVLINSKLQSLESWHLYELRPSQLNSYLFAPPPYHCPVPVVSSHCLGTCILEARNKPRCTSQSAIKLSCGMIVHAKNKAVAPINHTVNRTRFTSNNGRLPSMGCTRQLASSGH